MKCYKCLGEAIEKKTNYIADLGQGVVIIRQVPSFVCPKCGEVMYTAAVAKKLEKLVDYGRNSLMEIVVMSYSDSAA